MRLYWEVARGALQRQMAHRTKKLAGLATNAFCGYLRAAVFALLYGLSGVCLAVAEIVAAARETPW
jgi:hypothetical protein